MRWVVLVVLAGCFPRPSDALLCAVEADCTDGRTCDQGFCVVAPDAGIIEQAPPVDSVSNNVVQNRVIECPWRTSG